MSFDDVLFAAQEVESFLQVRGWGYCIIGGVALQRWGAVRFTQDVDLTLLTGFGEEEKFIEPLLERFRPRRPDLREFALRHRVVLLQTEKGIDVDIALGALPFEINSIERSSVWEYETGKFLRTCSAEDLIIHKVFAGRNQDWADVETVVGRGLEGLDFKLIRAELRPLLELKEEAQSLDRLDEIVKNVKRRI